MASGPTIIAKFLADTSQMSSEVDKTTSTTGSKISGWAKGAALAIGGAFAVGEIVNFGKESVAAAAADAEGQAKLAAALKSTAGATDTQVASAEKFISGLSKSAAIADDDLRPALATLARGFGDTEKAQSALSLATDISAGTGKDLSTVTEAMMKAAQGNTGALGRLGIATKDASGHALTLDEIMGNAAKTFKGQAATAAESTAGKMRSAQIAMGELQETVGNALLPVMATLATFLTGTVLPAVTTTFGWIMDHKDIIVAALIAIAVVITATLGPAFVAWAAGAAAAAAATLLAAAPFIAIGAVIAGVAYLIIHNWDTIVAATTAAFDAVVGAIKTAFEWVKDNWPLLLAIITGPIGAAVLIVVRNWDTIKAAAQAVWDWISNTWNQLVGIISGPIVAAKDLVVGAWDAMKSAATAAYDWIKGKFDAIGGAIEAVVGGITTAVGKVVSAITGPINAVIGAWNNLSFTIPSISTPKVHVPGTNIDFGGEIFGGHTFDFPNLPTLAAGGLLTSPTLFLGGEAGTEIVSPEALMRQIIREEGGGSRYTLNMYPRTADAADVAYGFRRLELMAGVA